MPFLPSPLERLLFLRANVGPAVIFDLLGSVGIKALMAARRLGALQALACGGATVEDLGLRIGADPARLQRLLDLLVELRYLRTRSGRYRLSRGTKKWLTDTSGTEYAAFVEWWDGLVLPYWDAELTHVIRGDSNGRLYEWVGAQKDGWRRAQEGFEAAARLILPAAVSKMELPGGSARMLDAGGGHGLYSIALCKAHPGLSADVFDVPEALERARDNVVSAGLEKRVRLLPGDLTTDHLGDGYDIVLLANVIHGFSPDMNIDLMRRAHDALNPGAAVHILDQFGRVPGRLGRAIFAMLALGYLAIGEGAIYSSVEVEGWLEIAGFTDVISTPLRRAPGNGLIIGRRRSSPGTQS